MKKSVIIAVCLIVVAIAGAYFLQTDNKVEKTGIWKDAKYVKDTEIGKGEKTVITEVRAGDNSIVFTIHTDKETLGEALTEHKLIEGEKGPYGLYVKVVNGIRADYDEDKSYWSLTKKGEPVTTGVDSTKIADNEHYELVYTK